MVRVAGGAALAAILASPVLAGGIERTTQSTAILFEDGNYAELTYGSVSPSLTGANVAVAPVLPSLPIGNVADDYGLPAAGLKFEVSDKVDVAFTFDTPFGADILYPTNPMLGGTKAVADTTAMTALMKYSFTDRISAFGGLRYQKAEGNITLSGLAYGGVSGYNVDLQSDSGTGYVIGAAYEIPEIAMRVALSYNSDITHNMDTTETLGGAVIGASTTKVKTPESINLEFQTGIAKDTLVFGSIRHVKHSTFRVDPATFVALTGGGLIDLSDTTTYRIGLGRRFTDKWSGAVTLAYEDSGDKLVSPLAPSTGYTQIGLAASYQATEQLKITGGVSYTMVGDAMPETGTPDVARADFRNNDVWGVGIRIGYSF